MNLSGRNIIILGAVIFILAAALVFIPKYQSAIYLSKIIPDLTSLEAKDRVAVLRDVELYENSARTTLAQIVGGLVILLGLYFTYLNSRIAQENLRVTEEGKLTDRFSKAVEMLGSEKLDVRLGGIYALERIARDSKKDHWTVMEVLTAFVRQNSNIFLKEPNFVEDVDIDVDGPFENPREDIQAIMTVIGRRQWVDKETESLNLEEVNLIVCDLTNANLTNVNFNVAYLTNALLGNANLTKASFFEADLSTAYLGKAKLDEAFLVCANLEGARGLTLEQILTASNFEQAKLPPNIEAELKERQAKQIAEKPD